MSDPYFQSLFADRIGGANYGKGTAIYKFEKIKRAKRKALADHPERKLLDFGIGENDAMAPEIVRRRMAEEINKPENRGYADNGPPAFKEAVARFMQREFGVALDPATRGQSLHRLEDGAGDAAGLLHQSGRRHADDRARLPGRRHAHAAITAASSTSCRSRPRTTFCPISTAFPPTSRHKAKLLVLCYPEQPDRQDGPARVLRAGDRLRQEATTSSSSRTRPTAS